MRNRPSARAAQMLVLAFSPFACVCLHAQVSLTSAVELALRNSPRIKQSEAEVAKARAVRSESKDVFIPAINAGAGLGQAYGYSPNPPTLFTFNAQSLVYNASQLPYIHSATDGLNAAKDSLEDVRQAVAEDAALTFLALDHDQQREDILRQESDYTSRLVQIVQERLDAGRDTQSDLTGARLAAAQIRLARLRATDDTANDRSHLARLMGLSPAIALRAEGGFPAGAIPTDSSPSANGYASPAVAAAFATAKAKQQAALGDSKYLYRPNIALFVQYNRYATFTNSFKQLRTIDPNPTPSCEADPSGPDCTVQIGANEEAFGVQISVPLFDRFRKAKNQESAAEASRALHEAETAQMNALDGQFRLGHAIEILQAQAEVAVLEQERAQQQLEVVRLQLTSVPAAGTPALTPKDEQNARIAEREKFLAVTDTTFQLHQNEVSLLRQTGRLLEWLARAGLVAPPLPTPPTLKHP